MKKTVVAIVLLLLLPACMQLDYYLSSATGHLQVISKRQSIKDLLQKKSTPEELQQRLKKISQIRDFASRRLGLPENGSYRSYVELDRPYVVWNVVATPEFSLEPLQWCFPIVGCVSYRGYFKQDDAREFANSLDSDDFDTALVGVPAYSTLNWFDDPVLSTFSDWPTPSIAKLIFHEVAHQKLYVPDDTAFNESFATAVEQIGIELWLEQEKDPEMSKNFALLTQRQRQFQQLLRQTRNELQQLYRQKRPEEQLRNGKQAIFSSMNQSYQQLRESWNGYAGYDAWFNTLNNARFASINAYHRWVPAFRLAMQQEKNNFASFYRRCQAIAKLPGRQRRQLLDRLTAEYHSLPKKNNVASKSPATAPPL